MVQEGRFREDLLFRLRTLEIESPPLRELLEDIKRIALYYINDLCERFGIVAKAASPEFWSIVTEYKWPGNVRELIQALEKALLSAKDEPLLYPKHLPTYIRIQVARRFFPRKPLSQATPEMGSGAPYATQKLKEFRSAAVAEAERQYMKELISLTGGDNDKACRISGLSPSRFYTLRRKYVHAGRHKPE